MSKVTKETPYLNILHPEPVCPYCGQKNDAAHGTQNNTNPPKGGDVSFCLYCLNINCYNDDLTLRKPTQEDLDSIEAAGLTEVFDRLKAYYKPMSKQNRIRNAARF